MDRTSLHFDAPLLGQPIAEKDETGAWTDYLFAGGKRIARVGQFAATPVAARQVVVRFTNDTCSACLGQPPFQDRNLQVDSITIGGTTIPSSDPSVSFAGGYYVPPGLMATNGDLTFTLASPLTGPVSVQAWGTPDTGVYPHMQVLVNGALVSEYDVTASPQAYTAALTPTDPSVTTTFYLADHLGSAQMEFSSNGTPLSSSQFFPFGGEINPVPTTNHYKFTGKERDTESGLDYFGARYYASSMGRWISPDWSSHPQAIPYVNMSDPQSLNLYGYVGNNPLAHRDGDGHSCTADSWNSKTNTLTAGVCKLDWWDFPGHVFVGFATLITSHTPRQAANGAGHMAYGYGGQILLGLVEGAVVEGVGTVVSSSGSTVIVERVMSQAELDATESTGLLRGGRDGTHYVTDSVGTNSAGEAQNSLALPTTPQVKVRMEMDSGALSKPSTVQPANGMSGGGSERTASGQVSVKILSVEKLH